MDAAVQRRARGARSVRGLVCVSLACVAIACLAVSAHAQTPPAPSVEALPADLLPHDLSPWGMFMNADQLVKAVMIGLAFASVVTWTIALAKWLELAAFKVRLRKIAPRHRRGTVSGRSPDPGRSERECGRRAGPRRRAGAREIAGSFGPRGHPRAAGGDHRAHRSDASGASLGAGPAFSAPSAPPRRSSACSAPSGAS